MINIFALVLVVFPLSTIAGSLGLQHILKDKIVTTAVVALIFMTLAFTVFNKTFLIWVLIYSILAFISAWLWEVKNE